MLSTRISPSFEDLLQLGLVLGAIATTQRCRTLISFGIDKDRAQVPIGIDVHGSGSAGIKTRPVDATDKAVLVRGPAGSDTADGNCIGVAGKTRIADVDIVADDAWVGTGVSA